MSIASSYAKALYEAARENNACSDEFTKYKVQLEFFHSLLSESKDVRLALLSPVITLKEKLEVIEILSKKFEISDLLFRFFSLLVKKGRLDFLGEVIESFRTACLAAEGRMAGRLVSIEPLSEKDIAILAKAFSQKLGKKVVFQVSTDPSLLAGMKVTVNGVTYDGSLRSQLQKLRDCFVAGMPSTYA